MKGENLKKLDISPDFSVLIPLHFLVQDFRGINSSAYVIG